MSVAFGYNGYVGLKKETTYGTWVVADDFMRANSESVKKTRTFITPDLIGGSRFQQVRLDGNEAVAGSIDFPVNLEDGIGTLLKDLLGTETENSLESGTAGSHLFVPKTTLGLTGISMELSRDNGVHADNVWKASGGHVGALSFEFAPGQPLKCVAEMTFQNLIKGATGQTPTYGSMARYAMCHTGTIELPDGTAANIKSGNLKIDGGLMSDRYVLGSKLIIAQQPGIYQITGSVVLVFDSLNRVDDYLASTARSVQMKVTCDTIGATVTGLDFVLGNIYLDGETPSVGDTGEITLTLPFRSISGTAATLASVTLTNSNPSAY